MARHQFTTETARVNGRRGGIASGSKTRRRLGELCATDVRLAVRAADMLARGTPLQIIYDILSERVKL